MEAFENLDALGKENQVEQAPDLSVSNTTEKAENNGEPVKPVVAQNKPKQKKNPILEAAKVGGEVMSDAGTITPGVDISKYEKYLPGSNGMISTPLDLWNKERAIRQSNWEQAGNAGMRIIANVIPETIQQASRMLDFSGDYSSDNIFGKAMQSWKDTVNEGTPIYRENPDEVMDFGDFAYWMEQGSNLVQSAAAFAILGYATAGVGGMAMKGIGMGARAVAGARTGAGIAQFLETTGNGLLNTYLMNKAEGVGVAIDTYKQVEEQTLAELRQNNGKAKKSENEIQLEAKRKAAEAASFAYNFNQINILLNLTSSFAFVKPFAQGSRLRLSTDGLLNGALNTTQRTAKQELLHTGLEVLREGAQEYAEETINYIAQQRAANGDYKKSYSELFKNSLADATSKQGIEQGMWGAIGGIAQTGFTKAGHFVPLHKNTAYQDAYNNAIGSLQREVDNGKASYTEDEIRQKAEQIATEKAGNKNKKVSHNYLKNYRDKKIIEGRQAILDNFKIDEDEESPNNGKNKILETSTVFKNAEEQFRLLDEQQKAYENNDMQKVNEINDILLTNQIQKAIETGTLNTLEQSVKEIAKLTPDIAQEQGFDINVESPTYYKTKAKEALDLIKRMETNAIRNEKYLNNNDVNDIDKELIVQENLYNHNEKLFNHYRKKSFEFRYKNLHSTTPYLKGTIEEYNSLSPVEKQALYTPEQITEITNKVKQADALYNKEFGNPSKEELNNDAELNRLWENKENVKQRITSLLKDKEYLTSKETQHKIKQIQIDAEQESLRFKQQVKEAEKKRKLEEKQNKKIIEEQVKQNKKNEKETKPAVSTSLSNENKNITSKEEKIENPTTTKVEQREDGVFEFKDVKNNKKHLLEKIENLSDENYYITHITSDNNAINIYNSKLKMPAGVSSTTNIVTKEQLKELLLSLDDKISPHRNYYDLFIGKINKDILLKQTGKTLSDKLESYLDENHIDDVANTTLPSSLNFGYYSNGKLVINETNNTSANTIILSNNKSYTKLTKELGDNNSFVVKYTNIITSLLDAIKQRNTNIDNEWFDKKINALKNIIINTKEEEKAILINHPDLEPLYDKGIKVTSLINSFINEEIKRFENIKQIYDNINNLISETNIAQEKELSSFDEEEDNQNIENESEGVINLDAIIDTNNNKLDVKNPLKIATTLLELINNLNKEGIEISSFGELYTQLSNASSKTLVDNILPRLKNIWNFLIEDNKIAGNNVKDDSFTIDEIGTDINNLIEDTLVDNVWSDNSEDNLSQQLFNIVNNINQLDNTLPTLKTSGTGAKSTSSLNIAYNAREHINRLSIEGNLTVQQKTDANNELNENTSYDLLDTNALPIGSELTLLPLGIGKKHFYYDFKTKNKIEFERLNKDEVKKTIYNGNIIISSDILSAIDNLPIFISKSSKEADIIQGAFLHTIDWINTDNIAGDENELQLQKQVLQTLREKVVNNLTKQGNNKRFVKVKINNKSLGVPITTKTKTDKSSNRLVNPLSLGVVTGNYLKSKLNESITYHNNLNLNNVPNGTTMVLLPVGKQQVAYPLRKSKLIDINDNNIKISIKTVLDLFFTENNNLTKEQKELINSFNTLGLNVKDFNQVKSYLKQFLYVDTLKKADNSNKDAFLNFVNNRNNRYNDLSIFRLVKDTNGTPYLQFGRVGAKGFELSFETIKQNKEDLFNNLDGVLDNTYINTNLDFLNSKNKVLGVTFDDNNKVIPSILYNSYNDMIKDVTITDLDPKEIINSKTGKRKTIYTFQNTIQLSEPINSINKKPIEKIESKVNEIKEEIKQEPKISKLSSFLNVNKNLFSFDETPDKRNDLLSPVSVDFALENKYTYINGLTSPIQNTIINNIKNTIEQHIVTTKKPISIEKALNTVIKNIDNYIGEIEKEYNENKDVLEEQQKQQYEDYLSLTKDKIKIIKENKNKLIKRTSLFLKQEGIAINLVGKDKTNYLNTIKLNIKKIKDIKEKIELDTISDEEKIEMQNLLLSGDYQDAQDLLEMGYDEDSEAMYEMTSISVNPTTSLTKEIKSFFNSIRETEITQDNEFVPVSNYLGLYNYIPFNTVYQKLQELLAIYPNKENITPTFENYLKILKQNQHQIPYLTDVINKLEDKETSEQFKNQFISSMYKMYNNTTFLHTKYDNKSNSFVSYLINTDSSNYANVLKDNWINNFNTLKNTEIIDANTDNPKKILKDSIKQEIYNNYISLLNNKNNITKENIANLFLPLGIEIPSKMLNDLANNNFYYNNVKYSLSSFIKDDNISRIINYIIGNPTEGTTGISNLLEEDIYGDGAFTKLANMIAIYEDNLTSNSSKNLGGDMIFNYGEVKNLVDNFNKLKNNLPYLVKSLSDPYRQLEDKETIDLKRYNTWLEQLLIEENGNYNYNEASPFYKSFNYFTFLGGKVKDSDGNTVYEVDKYSTNGLTKAKLNLFLNQAKTIGTGENKTHIANYMFFTMSDKKVPMGFSAPSVRFNTSTIFKSLIDNNTKEANHQLNYLFDTLVKPDIQRILFLANENTEDNINIKGYSNENSRFYSIPALNLIDFDYVDGDINNEKDKDNKLKESLGLSKDENLFVLYGEGKDIKKEINITVLQKPEVQAFLKEKMRQWLKNKVNEETINLKTQGLLVTKENKTDFSEDSNIDKKAIKELKKDGEYSVITNYVLNTTVALAQFQQLLIGDPIQFFKESKVSSTIKKQLENNLRKKAILNHNIKIGKNNEQENINSLNSLITEYEELIKKYNKSWAINDILETNNNQGKRLAGDNASGSKILFSPDNDSYNLLVLNDNEVKTNLKDYYYNLLVPEEVKNMPESTNQELISKRKEINKYIGKYDEINQADAQELTTLKEHLDTMVGLGEITSIQANSLLKADEEGNLTFKQFNQVIQPMKLVYSNNFIRDGINSRLYIKSSSFPLAKTFTKGLPIDTLRQFMEDNNIHRTAFKSAVKVGQPKSKLINIFNKDNTITIGNKEKLLNTVIKEIPREGHKKQQNVPYDENKHQINDGTQKAKLLFLNLMDVKGFKNPETGKEETGRELYNNYKEVYRQYYKIKYDDLIKELFPEGFNNGLDYEKLQSIILEEAEARGFSENDMAYFELNKLKNNFEFPLWLSNNEGKLTSLLNAIVDNRIRKRKREGKSAVLLSDIVISTNPKYKSNIVFVNKDRTSNELQTMRDENGEIKEAEVVMSFPFRDNNGNKLHIEDFLSDDKTHIDLEKLPQDILDTIGFRIPTQGLNSMNAIKIVGFLPEDIQNTVIAPRDFITQMGSDFDVDKLYQDLVNTYYEDGKLSKLNKTHFDYYLEVKDFKRKLKTIKRLKNEANNEQNEQKKKAILTRVDIISKELEKTRKEISQDEYLEKSNNIPKDLELKYLENLMLDYNKAVLTNPSKEVQKQRVQPIDSEVFREITEQIVNDVFNEDINDNWTPYSDSFQTKKYISARGGKTGVSTYSSTSVLNTILQTTDYSKEPINFQYYSKKEETYKPNEYYLFGNKSNVLNNPYSVDGRYKSDVIQALQSISVDNENLQMMHKLNLNDYTSDFIRASTLLGFTAKDIFYIINHPVVKEYVRGKQMGDKIIKPNYFYEEVDGKGVKKEIPYTKKQIQEALNSLTHNQIKEDIKNNNFNQKDLSHFAIYNIFEELTEKGKTLKSIESLLNTDSKGLGSNLFYSLEKENAILNLVTNKELSNLRKLLGEFKRDFDDTEKAQILIKYNEDGSINKEYKELKREYENALRDKNYIKLNGMWFKANNIPSMATVYALVTNNKIWKNQFPYHSIVINSVTNLGLRLENNKKVDKLYNVTDEKPIKNKDSFVERQIEGDSIATTSPTKDSEIKQKTLSAFKSFLFTSIVNKSATEVRKDLFLNNNIADIVSFIKKENLLPYNTFIKKLTVNNINKDEVNVLNNIEYNATGIDTVEENAMVIDIISLLKNNNTFEYNNKTYSFAEIGQLLVAHQMLTGGIQKASQFIKHIPPHYLQAVNLYNNILNKLNNSNTIGHNELYSLFLEQYIQHNPHLVVSNTLNAKYKAGVTKIQDGVIIMDSLPLDINKIYEDLTSNYISIQNPNGTYSLFKRSSIDNYRFIRIPVLGKNQILEYDINTNKTVESIFEENNPSAKWYKNETILNELISKGLEPNSIKNKINEKLELGLKDNKNSEAIVKVCK